MRRGRAAREVAGVRGEKEDDGRQISNKGKGCRMMTGEQEHNEKQLIRWSDS